MTRCPACGHEWDKGSVNGHRSESVAVLDFLNSKRPGKLGYRPVDANLRLIAARLAEGATVGECKAVIANRSREWGRDPLMQKYLRPATIFGATKFAQYLGELTDDLLP